MNDATEILEKLNQKLVKTKTFDKKIRLDLGDRIWVIDGCANPPQLLEEDGVCDVSAVLSMQHFGELLAGKLNAQLALMSGKIKIKGDMLSALPLIKLL